MRQIGMLMSRKKSSIYNFPNNLLLMLFFAFAGISPAQAEISLTGLYGGFFLSDSTDEFTPEGGGDRVSQNRGLAKIKLGKELSDILAVEGQFGLTSSSDDKKAISIFGAYLRAGKDFGKVKIYGLLGFGSIYAYEDGFENVSESGGSYGVGIEIFGSKDLAITIEYIDLIDKSVDGGDPAFGKGDLKFDITSIGFTYYFSEENSQFAKNRDKIRSIRY
jgi:hypothetical protein